MTTYLIRPGKSGGYRHRTGGRRKETCPLCGNQLVSLLVYDVADEKILWELEGIFEIPLVYCFACDLWEMAYKINGNELIVQNGDGIGDDNGIQDMALSDVMFEIVPTGLQYESDEYRDWYLKNDLGRVPQPFPHIGKPFAVLNDLLPKECCGCGRDMIFVAALYNTKTIRFDLNMSGSQIVYRYCKHCVILHAAIHCT